MGNVLGNGNYRHYEQIWDKIDISEQHRLFKTDRPKMYRLSESVPISKIFCPHHLDHPDRSEYPVHANRPFATSSKL